MKKTILFCFAVASILSGAEGLKHTETVQRTFRAAKVLDVDNIWGATHVIGYSGQQIQMTAVRTDEAESQEALSRAAREVSLKTDERDGELNIYPDGPFRGSSHHSHETHPGYHVSFDITVRVPASTTLKLGNVQGGIDVQGVTGEFDVHAVNGPVELKEIGGFGRVGTVNGKLQVAFTRNPTQPCTFKTVNGPIEVQLHSGLNADLRFKALNGGIFTDFETTSVAGVAGTTERRDGKFVYRSRGTSSTRIGNGGPVLSFETVNGAIRILKK